MKLQLLGGFVVIGDCGSAAPLDGRKSQELLGYLVLTRDKTKLRDIAVEALWPEANPDTGRKQIRQALWQIHQAFDGETGERLILAEGDHLCMNPARDLWCDALEFADMIDHFSELPTGRTREQNLEQALEWYQGPLLDGCYSEWCLIERERLESMYLLGLDAASSQAERHRNYWVAMRHASALLRIDPAHERTHRRLMRLYYLLGDRTKALRQFQRCSCALKVEFGVQPSSRTTDVWSAIRDDLDLPGHESSSVLTSGETHDAPAPAVDGIAALSSLIDDLYRSVHNL